MFLTLDLSSETPIYQQIRDLIIIEIAHGRLHDGDALPPTRQLAKEFGINYHTVHRAYDMLRQDGFVRLTRKQGTVIHLSPLVDHITTPSWMFRLKTVLAEAYVHGISAADINKTCTGMLESFGSV